jgi:hypothetical protein
MIKYTNADAHRTVRKWLNEDIIAPIDRQALATLLHHYSELIGEYNETYTERCPYCYSMLVSGDNYSGVKCGREFDSKCSYWFCF